MERRWRNRAAGSLSLATTVVLLAACNGRTTEEPPEQVISDLRDRFPALAGQVPNTSQTPLPHPGSLVGPAATFDFDVSGLRPRFGTSAPKLEARVILPAHAASPFRVEDIASGVAVDVLMRDALDVKATTSGGYVIYQQAHPTGATVLHYALLVGTEEFVKFAKKPSTSQLAYRVSLVAKVSGLRLVANTLEMIDAGGAPRLRIAPPFVVGSDGSRVEALLEVEGCAVDRDPSAPWGRPVTPPGAAECTVQVSWDDTSLTYPAVLDPRWTTTGSMTAARQGHTATLLSTGKVLVVGGGTSSTTALASAELFDRTTGTWAATASMTGARQLHSATQLGTSSNSTTSGKVLISGGYNGSASVNTAQLYSPTSGTWIAAGNLNVPRHKHAASILADGRVLVAGGLNGTTTLANAAIYNPASGAGSWAATTGPLPPTGQSGHTATLLSTSNMQLNNKVLLVGGNNGTSTLSAVYLFDPVQSAFSTLASMPAAREGHTATVLANGNILFAGGKNGTTTLATAALFNPSSGPGTWTTTGSMASPRQGHTATLIPSTIVANGQVLVAGGSNGATTVSTAELFNGVSTWASTSALAAPSQGHTATALSNGAILIAGGLSGTTTLNTAQLYDASLGLACMSNSQCTTGACISGVCCDSPCNSGCGSCTLAGKVGLCSPLSVGTSCRASAGPCDVAETCSGTSTSCPADALVPSGSLCRPAVDLCDAAETCTGTSAACPADSLKPTGTTCRPAADQCDVAEVCSGSSTACPGDAKAANGTVCDDQNHCTQTDSCQSGTCVGTSPVVCTAIDQCHTQGSCNTATGACSNPAKPDGTACNDQNACTLTDVCTGGSCAGANTPNCDDGNVCTQDACDSTVGCTHTTLPCNIRTGRIEAETYDSQNGMTTALQSVAPSQPGAWIQFNAVDFGSPGDKGRFQVMLNGAAVDQHLELHLDSPNGVLVADLLTLATDLNAPPPQSTKFLTPVSGVHPVAIVARSVSVGNIDWFSLEKGVGQDTVSQFPSSFHHNNPGQGMPDLTNLPLAEEEEDDGDVPPDKWAHSTGPIQLAPGQFNKVTFTTSGPVAVTGGARWAGDGSEIQVLILDATGATLAMGTTTSYAGSARASVTIPLLSAQTVSVAILNIGNDNRTVMMSAGAVQHSP